MNRYFLSPSGWELKSSPWELKSSSWELKSSGWEIECVRLKPLNLARKRGCPSA
ncbi:hypothetical protein [Phocaeicola sp.]